ncbi:phosphatase PAP2 family protein [Winogradskyella marincola]|uniref:Phosphatase PAP2 family protein n=1 Tax=Winogradskyella marincola TaxID=3037795 RepID=A0ABT6G524_9FLAO|nr:phosphatase PAP2 family protein [Winogradskyella sp. YYF002]MDG4717146.1 phosphatase PAP2 family protein [Winogradskyella sp. YYF002]
MLLAKRLFTTLILIVFSTQCIDAQHLYKIDQDSASTWSLLKYDINTTWHGVKYSFTRPLHWKKNDFLKLSGLVFGTATLALADEGVDKYIDNHRSNFPKVVRDYGWYFGSPQNYFMANAGLYGFGLVTKNSKIRRTSVLIITSSITSGLIQTVAKNGFGRARPGTGKGAFHFKLFSKEAGQHSFPSGHTVLSVTMAHSIAKQFESPWIKAGVYTLGAIPPMSRLIDGAHWLTDIGFSTALSIIVVDSVDKFLFKEEAFDIIEPNKNKISWSFAFTGNQIGLVGRF